MTERLSPTEIEIIRRSLVMSPTLPAPTAESLLTEIQRLREQLKAVDGELAEIEAPYGELGPTSLGIDRLPGSWAQAQSPAFAQFRVNAAFPAIPAPSYEKTTAHRLKW